MKPYVVPWRRRIPCIRITCENGVIIRLVKYPVDLRMSNGQLYKHGYDFSGFMAGSGFSPSAIDLTGMIGFGATEVQLVSGVFDSARARIFFVDWSAPVEDAEPVFQGILGKIKVNDKKYTCEVMHLVDAYNQTVGETHPATCKKEFGGQEWYGTPAGCKVDLGPLTVTGAVTFVNTPLHFQDASLLQEANYFTWGEVWFNTGPNAGIPPRKIKAFSGGFILLYEGNPFPYPISIGDAFQIVPGCGKTIADCNYWNNVINFGGYWVLPGPNVLKAQGTK